MKQARLLRSLRLPALAAAACLGAGGGEAGATVVTQTFNFSGSPIVGGDDPGYFPNVTIEFEYDDACMTSSCSLQVTLTYNGSNQDDLEFIGQTLAGVSFDTYDGATQTQLDVDRSSSTAIAEKLVGAGSADALTDFGDGDNIDVDVSGHWGFVSGFVSTGGLGSNVLSSVGDAFPDEGAVGMMDLFDGIISEVEENPPDGTSFSIVDDATCTGQDDPATCGGKEEGFQDSLNRAWVQNQLVATLVYDGSTNKLTNIDHVDPLFGTEGRPLPAPGALGLVALGLLGLVWKGRRAG